MPTRKSELKELMIKISLKEKPTRKDLVRLVNCGIILSEFIESYLLSAPVGDKVFEEGLKKYQESINTLKGRT